jgi:flagellar hook-associated protein 3 FlgL
MRITRQTVLQNALRGLRSNLDAMSRAQQEVATGRRITKLSDQPNDASVVIKLDSQLRQLDRYRRAITSVNTRLSTEEAVLEAVRKLVDQARDTVRGLNGQSDDPLLRAAVEEVQAIHRQVVSLGNTRISGEYIFGGGKGATSPFLDDGTYVGGDTIRELEIGEGVRVPTNHTGDEVLSGLLQSLDQLATELETGTPETIRSVMANLEADQATLQSAHGEVAGRMRQATEMESYLIRKTESLRDHKQEIQDADPSESVLKLQEATAALERAYAAVAEVLSTNILNYLK